MPPQTIDACLNDVVLVGVKNIQDAAVNSNFDLVRIESEHIEFVSSIIRNYLLYEHFDGWDNRVLNEYCNVVRPNYILNTCAEYADKMEVSWLMMDKALEMYWYSKEVKGG